MRTKIGIVGSRAYTNKKRIKDLIFTIKEKDASLAREPVNKVGRCCAPLFP